MHATDLLPKFQFKSLNKETFEVAFLYFDFMKKDLNWDKINVLTPLTKHGKKRVSGTSWKILGA